MEQNLQLHHKHCMMGRLGTGNPPQNPLIDFHIATSHNQAAHHINDADVRYQMDMFEEHQLDMLKDVISILAPAIADLKQ